MYQSRDTLLTPPTLAATLAFLGVWYLITSNIYLTWAAWEPDIRLLSYSYALRPNESKGTWMVGWKSSVRLAESGPLPTLTFLSFFPTRHACHLVN